MLNRIGATRTMEDFISFILSIAADETGALKPVYGIVPNEPLNEWIAERLPGLCGHGPGGMGNAGS
jgi:hypothetical protein